MTGTDLVMPVLGAERVLVVEPGEDAAASLTALLRLQGFDARAARTAPDALTAADALQPAVVVIDLDLGVDDPCGVVRRLRAKPKPPAVVVVTALAARSWRKAAADAGAVAYLLKPADPTELANLIRRHAARPAH